MNRQKVRTSGKEAEGFLLGMHSVLLSPVGRRAVWKDNQAPWTPQRPSLQLLLPSLLYWDLSDNAGPPSQPMSQEKIPVKRLTRERTPGAREHLVWNGLCRTPKWINIIYRRPVGLKMNGANAALNLKDSEAPEIHKKASFNFQTRLLNKARKGWNGGERGLFKRNKALWWRNINLNIHMVLKYMFEISRMRCS